MDIENKVEFTNQISFFDLFGKRNDVDRFSWLVELTGEKRETGETDIHIQEETSHRTRVAGATKNLVILFYCLF